MKAAVIYSDIFLEHNLPSHPENARRLEHFLKGLKKGNLPLVEPKRVSEELLLEVHTKTHIEMIKRYSTPGNVVFVDPDTYITGRSFEAAMHAAGAVEKAVEMVSRGEAKAVFCAVRPPGHHATRSGPMGFCLFNNVSVGATKALKEGFQKVLIVDFDAHHGNGTQDIFYDNPNVFYFSTHQFPFYPGTGSPKENKENVMNVPMPAGAGDEEYKRAYGETLPKVADAFKPDIILVSAGFDLHEADPLTNLMVTDSGVRFILESIAGIAKKSGVPLVFCLEGGYSLKALERCGEAVAEVLTSFEREAEK